MNRVRSTESVYTASMYILVEKVDPNSRNRSKKVKKNLNFYPLSLASDTHHLNLMVLSSRKIK